MNLSGQSVIEEGERADMRVACESDYRKLANAIWCIGLERNSFESGRGRRMDEPRLARSVALTMTIP